MSRSEDVEVLLGRAEALGKEYDWLKAAELYEEALPAVGKKDFLGKGEVQERIGYCIHRAAFQSKDQREFREKIRQAVEAYEKANGFYEKLVDEQRAAKMFRCGAVVKYLGYWLASDPSKKRNLLDECLELEEKALAIFSESGDIVKYGRTYNELLLVFYCRASLEWDRQTLKGIVERGLDWGEKAVASLSEHSELHEIAKAYFTLATCVYFLERFIVEPEEIDENRLKAVRYLSKAVDLSEKVGDVYLLGLSHSWLGENTEDEESERHFEKVLECSEKTRDNFLKAEGLDFLAYKTYWRALATEDSDQRRELAKAAMKFYDRARHHSSIISYLSPRGAAIAPPGGYAEHYLQMAKWETNPQKRLEFLEKSEKAGMEALKLAEDSDIPSAISTVLHVISKTLQARAYAETESAKQRSRLEKALKYRERAMEIQEQLAPLKDKYWNLGVMRNYLAEIQAKLADTESDVDSRRRILEEAVLSKEKSLKLIDKVMPYYERMGYIMLFAALQGYQDTYATLLTHLYHLTNKPEHLRKAVEISRKAIESASKVDMVSRIAESHWEIAKVHDILREHLEAAENFEHASKNYLKAAEKIPQLKDFYQDYASYMQAWNEIEKARHDDGEKRYRQAKEHYDKAADLHKSTERWSHLSPNYLAWARLEEAEELSRREQTEEAKNRFRQAANLFEEAKKAIKQKLEEIENKDEKKLSANLAKASDIRREYCRGRIALEEAKILDRRGDHRASSKKYGSAAEIFQKIAKVEPEQSRKELQPIIYLCQAWQKMMMAEARASSTMYGEAAELFRKAKEHILDQPMSLLALANSSFCKALEAGTEFELTRDMAMYSMAKKHMEAAANHYLKAGFKTASEYVRATNRLFDAYSYMHKAETETELEKKAQYYQIAERLLQASAVSYMKAKHPEKSKEVRRLLESVKEERQFAMSLTEVLHAPAITSTTASFSTPTPTHEQAVGLERFEHAEIQANLILGAREVMVGEDIDLEIELVNAGKAPALLIKAEEIIPEAFEVKKAPEIYRVEDCHLNMKGKRLDPLKTEDVKLSLRPRTRGTFSVRPRILYVDEIGKYKCHEPKPVTVTVKELGIKGWIKGER